MVSTDRDALVALFRSTGGAKWSRKDNWDTDADISQWYGVTAVEGRVVKLSLVNNNLKGPIPKELGKLTALETLYLNGNNLSGRIPPELGKLAALEKLSLGWNQLSVPIPEELGKLTALQVLYLNNNNLSGPIPSELGNLSALKELYLWSNQLSGHIPRQLGDLGALQTLNLGYNELDGAIPAQLGALTKLTWLSLSNNGLDGQIPRQLGDLGSLQFLNLNNNKLDVCPRAAAERLATRGVRVDVADNPWKEPPANVMAMGMERAASFLRDLDDYGRTRSNRLKVVLVGLGEAGKTSIATRLDGRLASRCPKPDERTVGVEIRDIKLGPGPVSEVVGSDTELDVSLWDFAGQRAYYDTHQMFLTPGALFVLVVDVFAYSDEHSREDALDQWLDILQSRVPGSVVLLVGTHSDSFGADSAKRCERTEQLKKDVRDTSNRFRSECASATETELGKGHPDVQGNRRYQPLRIVLEEDLLGLNVTSAEGQAVELLQKRIEHLAYNGFEAYSFSSVRCVVPEPYLPAIATLEAVRRGADLRGSGGTQTEVARRMQEGDAKKGRWFIRFSDALSHFCEQQTIFTRVSNMFRQNANEAERVFFDAVKLHEDHGAILLTRVDGSGDASPKNLVIHVNPSRFADLVRRVVDIRLVDPLLQAKVIEAMQASTAVRSMLLTLSDQHKRFVQAGEVSKEYLKFLWLRDMELDQASQEAPPLKMTDEDINVVVGSLLDVRFMFRVRDGDDAFVPDRYVVASCLPNKAGPKVDPGSILELRPGCAIYSQKLKLVGAHAVPPGLVPRLLAWCGRGEGRIKACWKRGVCFAFKNHLVLLYEVRAIDGSSWIECHARGNDYDESARRALKDIGDQVDELFHDTKYGFPGLGLIRGDESTETVVSSDGEHEALVERIVSVLRDQMNVKFMMDRSMRHDVAFLRWPIPRLVCVIPAPEKSLEERDRSFEVWKADLQTWCLAGKKRGRGLATRKLRMFFLCPQDWSLAECGPEGQGYEITELLGWAKKVKPLAKVGLALASIALRVCTGLAISAADFKAALGTKAGNALSEFVEETLTSGIETMVSVAGDRLDDGRPTGVVRHAGSRRPGMAEVRLAPVQGFEYDQLKEVVKSLEVDGARNTNASFPSFDKAMKLVDRGGDGVEWAWVRARNVDQFASS